MNIHDDDDHDGLNDFLYDRYARDNSAIWFVVVVAVLIAAAAGLLASAVTAKAHSFYDLSCCSENDCKPLPDGSVKITQSGYLWDGETFPFNDKRVKYSPDGKYHGCALQYTGSKLCLYVPPQGF